MLKVSRLIHRSWAKVAESGYAYERQSLTLDSEPGQLGASLYRLQPGQKAFPAHYHYANDEAIYVLNGVLSLRVGEALLTLNAGDYVNLPAGLEQAHQAYNDSKQCCEFLCFSTMRVPDVMVYPDSGKVGVMADRAPGGASFSKKKGLKAFFKRCTQVGYYDK
jgi:uncharacterized cupin superfamily protein